MDSREIVGTVHKLDVQRPARRSSFVDSAAQNEGVVVDPVALTEPVLRVRQKFFVARPFSQPQGNQQRERLQ